MTNLNRMREAVAGDGSGLAQTSSTAGWSVVQGFASARPVSREMIAQSGLRLVAPQLLQPARSEYDPVFAAGSGTTPRWLQAMWFASVVVSGWALYWVSISA